MEALIADQKMKKKKKIRVVYLSESIGNCDPKGWRLFTVIH